jgi:hypothetical protein
MVIPFSSLTAVEGGISFAKEADGKEAVTPAIKEPLRMDLLDILGNDFIK